jgi:hypothetical protein
MQAGCDSAVVAVTSACPKESPVTVTDARPDDGVLTRANDDVGESKVKTGDPVPETALTVTAPETEITADIAAVLHCTLVVLVHADVVHTLSEILVLAE